MPVVISVLTDVIHIVKLLCIFVCFFSFNYRNVRFIKGKILLSAISVISMSICMFYFFNPIIDLIVYLLFVFLLTIFLFDEKVFKMLCLLLWTMFFVTLLDNISRVFIDVVMNHISFPYENISSLLASSISLIYVLMMACIYKKISNVGIKNIEYKYLITFLMLAIVDSLLITFLSDEVGKGARIYLTIALCIVVAGIFLQLAFVIILFVQRNAYKEQKQIIEIYLNNQKHYYEYLEKKEYETKKFRHDLQSHMQLMSKFIEENNYEELKKYYEKINNKIESFKSQATVYNGIADAIINQYYAIAVSKGIDMKVKGRFPVDCEVDAYDVCTIFSNILCNAIEAAEKADEKRILLECKYSDNRELFIFLNNTFKNIGTIVGNKIRTNKSNLEYHGFGMENVKDSIEKYKGFYDFEIHDNEFKVSIVLNY